MKQHRCVRMDTQRVLGARYVLEDTGCTRQLESLCMFTCVQLFVTPMDLARQAPLCMGFSRQEYWSGLPFPIPGDLPDPGIEAVSLSSLALAGRFFSNEPAALEEN